MAASRTGLSRPAASQRAAAQRPTGQDPPGIEEPAASATGSSPSAGIRYLADFVAVRRQRVQTSAFVGEPLVVMTNGWRFGW